jgi:hypothetical protein
MSVQDRGFEVGVDDGIPVGLPSGVIFPALTQDEADYLKVRVERYLADNHFVNISDFQDVDKMVVFELFVHRWSLWLSKGMDYYGEEIDAAKLAATIAAYSTELRLLKKNLGMDKPARDRSRGDDSIPAYLDALRQRAQEFGIHRNAQAAHVMETFQRMSALLTYHDNCTDEEQLEFHVTQEDIFQVFREEVAAWDALDEEFRTTVQTYWIRKM